LVHRSFFEGYSLADMGLEIGARGTATLTVEAKDTAIALGSGDVPVLGTPRVVALLEQAAVAALADGLDAGVTSVGTHIAIDHLAASFVGASIEAVAEVVAVDGRALSFRLTAFEGDRLVATGNHTRLAVDRERFLRPR
jgi:fluoroacetyl-CoA thioesterase